jgi:hypothetical protein
MTRPDRRTVDGLGAVELTFGRDLDDASPLGEFVVGHGPRGVRRLELSLVESSPLLGRRHL